MVLKTGVNNKWINGTYWIDVDGRKINFDINGNEIILKNFNWEAVSVAKCEKVLAKVRGHLAHKEIREKLIEMKKQKVDSVRLHGYTASRVFVDDGGPTPEERMGYIYEEQRARNTSEELNVCNDLAEPLAERETQEMSEFLSDRVSEMTDTSNS